MNFSKGGELKVSQDSTGFMQIIQPIALWPGLKADCSTSSSLIPLNMYPMLRLVLDLMFVSVCLMITEGKCCLDKGKSVK